MNKNIKKVKTSRLNQKLLTFWLEYAKIILEYIGIVVYFDSPRLSSLKDKIDCQNKKQKSFEPKYLRSRYFDQIKPKDIRLNRPEFCYFAAVELLKMNISRLLETFCFLPKRFYSKKIRLNTKNKNKKYDSWILSATRHFKRNRSQQNHFDPLGRERVNSRSQQGQPRLALLHQRPSRSNYSFSQRNGLFSQLRFKSKLKRKTDSDIRARLILLGFIFNKLFRQMSYQAKQSINFINKLAKAGLIG